MRSLARLRVFPRATRVAGAAIAVTLAFAACSPTPSPLPPTPTATSAPHATSVGLLVGGLEPCSGIVFPPPQPFAAGTIVVLRGQEGPDGALPTAVAATQSVNAGALFRFSLPSGTYVLVGHYATPTSISPWVQVTVTAASTTTQNIPNRCA